MSDDVKNQLVSGRWLLTMAAALAFVLLVAGYVAGKPSISPDAIAAIVGTVFANYFSMPRKDKDGGNPA